MKHILEIDSVELSFAEKDVLRGVYLKLETGNVVSILGGNGCGKTCLMNILQGRLKPTHKSIRINEVWYNQLPLKDVKYMPQFSFIPRSITVKEVLSDFRMDYSDLINCFPSFKEQRNIKCGVMSEGDKRILECYVIIKSPAKFIMLDEPFSQVMPIHVETIKSLILQEKQTKGFLVTDHMYKHVVDISDSMYVLSNGYVHVINEEADLIKHGYIRHLIP